MKIKLIKPFLLGSITKPAGREMDVTGEFGRDLVDQGIAVSEEYAAKQIEPKKKTKKK